MLRIYLSGFPAFVGYFSLSLLLIGAFIAAYSAITPHHEFRLVRAGNGAAVFALLGALVGFALPLRAAMAGSLNLVDFFIWALIAAAAQVIAYFGARMAMPDVSARITSGDVAAGAWLGGVAVVVGMLNAAAMTL
ncbi:DUF350 domain-containing protein [Azorhizobium oxalatiphilum]|uniref:DUF350 domain-containing protein n=1 Tax=Azorhizobium oxalatiphilum TaxID=980631 RepID=A0A917C998_9HYPH|nr:DUF350 domain-containing protein [Azorhizobium oxalatiphilum]GGF75886.1 DUF350 domain-containing protein [Azorhizobium oxalatiphilum]